MFLHFMAIARYPEFLAVILSAGKCNNEFRSKDPGSCEDFVNTLNNE